MPGDQLSLFNELRPYDNPTQPPSPNNDNIDPIAAFNAWIDQKRPAYRTSSKKVYRALWAKFIRHMTQQGIPFFRIEPNDVTLFLHTLDIKRQQKERYYHVLAMAFDELTHLVPDTESPINTQVGDPYRRTWRQAPSNDPMQFLMPQDQQHLLHAIAQHWQTQPPSANTTNLTFSAWKTQRDMAIVTSLYACGIKPAELTVLSVNCIFEEGHDCYLDVGEYQGISRYEQQAGRSDPNQDATHAWQAPEAGAQRKIPIPNWARPILLGWQQTVAQDLAYQALHAPAGAPVIWRLFPGSRAPSTKRPNTRMDMATLNRVVRQWGHKHAQLELTPQRLRNSYGAHLILQGKDLPQIEQLMGYAPGAASAFRLKTAWEAFCRREANAQAQLAQEPAP